jgi:SAM-dependent methyltransferase
MNLKMDHIMETSKTNNKFRNNCLISNKPIIKILDLGMHPYADTFVGKEQLHLSEPIFPLEVYLCPDSGHIQLGCVTNEDERYNLYEYSYTSANSKFATNHWDDYCERIKFRFDINSKKIIEIGCNDGYLLNQFKHNNEILGIDASKHMCDILKEKDIPFINECFDSSLQNPQLDKLGKVDLIIANNVFNHSNNPLDFAKGVSNLLGEEGIFVFELPYWKNTFDSGRFDQIYHEHVSYFTIKSSYNLLKSVGLEIFDFEEVDYHGGSIRIFARKSINPSLIEKIQIAIMKEEYLFNPTNYIEWGNKLQIKRNNFLYKLYNIKCAKPNIPIIGVGAAAKANTFLNYYKLDHSIIEYITDSSTSKQNKYTPLTRIPIVSDDIFKEYEEVYALILSWNISHVLAENLLKLNPQIKFINL